MPTINRFDGPSRARVWCCLRFDIFFVCYNMICLSSYIIYEGMAQFVTKFAEPGDAEYSPPVVLGETPVRCYTSAGFDLCSSVLH